MSVRVLFLVIFASAITGCSQSFESGNNPFAADVPQTTVNVGEGSAFADTDALLRAGEGFYTANCANCHGPKGAGDPGTSLLKSIRNDTFIHTTNTTMPPNNVAGCIDDCSVAVMAWVATQNGIDIDISSSNNQNSDSQTQQDDDSKKGTAGDMPDSGMSDSDSLDSSEAINRAIIQDSCIRCHTNSGIANKTSLIFVPGSDSIALMENTKQLSDYIDEFGIDQIMQKASAQVSHLGGTVLAQNSSEFADFYHYLQMIEIGDTDSDSASNGMNDDDMDGISNEIDMYPNDSDRAEESGFLYQRWSVPGISALNDSVVASVMQNAADVEEIILGDFSAPTKQGDNYLARMVTVFIPDASGQFKFFTNGDDYVELYFGESEATKQRIVKQGDWVEEGKYFSRDDQASDSIQLTAGKMYYLELMGVEKNGGDHFSVAWGPVTASNDAQVNVIPAKLMQLHISGQVMDDEDKNEIITFTGTYLSDLNWVSATAGRDDVEKDRANSKQPLIINGQQYDKGIGTHASSEIVYNLNREYDRFVSDIGMDDESNNNDGKGSVVFEVYSDNQKVYSSGTVNHNQIMSIDLDVSNVNSLRLVVTDAGDGNQSDHANWADARLLTASSDSSSNDSSSDDDTNGNGSNGDNGENESTSDDSMNNETASDLITRVNTEVLQAKCNACHKPNGFARDSRLLFLTGTDSATAIRNTNQIVEVTEAESVTYFLDKVLNNNDHGGKKQYSESAPQYILLKEFTDSLQMSQSGDDSSESDTGSDSGASSSDQDKPIVNVALNQSAEMNTVAFGGDAEKAVDGDKSSNNWVHSSRNSTEVSREWWQVQLEEQSYIDHFYITPRSGFNHRIEGGYIAVANEDISTLSLEAMNSDPSIDVFEITAVNTKLTADVHGQFVLVFGPIGEMLNFTEIDVMGYHSSVVEIEREVPEIEYSLLGETCETSKPIRPMLRRLTRDELVANINNAFPQLNNEWNPQLLSQDPSTEIGFDNDADLVAGTIGFVDEWRQVTESLATELTDNYYNQLVPCSGDGENCVRAELPNILKKLARRTVSTTDINEIVDYWKNVNAQADEFTAWKWTLTAAMQHPSVIYRSEIGERNGDTYTLTGREIADAIAFTYSGQPADEELLELADNGDLYDPQTRIDQAARLLQTPAGEDTMLRFFRIWLKLDKVKENPKDGIANFDEVANMMTEEAIRMVKRVIIDNNGTVGDLLTSQTTFVNQTLADYYELEQNTGDQWIEVNLDNRVGYLNTAAFLVGNSLPNMSSPTQRGMLIYRRMLCNDVPPAPPEIPSIDVEVADDLTNRERWVQAHTGDDACQSCHKNFDPLGFALENYDDLGQFRSIDNGKQVDATGEIPGFTPMPIDGPVQLASALATDERLANCASGFMNHWAFGGAGGQICLAENARKQLASGQLSMMEYFAAIAGELNFIQRSAE